MENRKDNWYTIYQIDSGLKLTIILSMLATLISIIVFNSTTMIVLALIFMIYDIVVFRYIIKDFIVDKINKLIKR